jgi:hypothetical protein
MFKVMAVESIPVLGSPGALWDLLQSDAAMATGGAVGAKDGSFLTMESGEGLLLAGVILVSGFGSVFVDPSVSQEQFTGPSPATNLNSSTVKRPLLVNQVLLSMATS